MPSHLTVTLESKLSDFAPLLKDVLEAKLELDQKEWVRADGPKGVEIETRIHAGLGEEPTLTMRERTLTVDIPIAYHGDVRARVKTPFGHVWLTRGTAWGTKAEPAKVMLRVNVEASVRNGARVFTKSALDHMTFTAPSMEKVCASGVLKICISRDDAAKYVHAEVEKVIRDEAAPALAALDETIAREANLSRIVDPALAALRTPQQTALGSWLALTPRAAALARWSGKEDTLSLGGELWMEPTFSLDRPAVANEAILLRDATDDPSVLRLDLLLTFEQLSRAYTEAAKRVRTRSVKVAAVRVLGADPDGKHLVIALVLERDKRRSEVYVRGEPVIRDGALALATVTATEPSLVGLAHARANEAELSAALTREMVVALSPLLADHVSAIRTRMAALLSAFGTLELTPERQSFGSQVAFEEKALRVRSEVSVSAQLVH